MTRFRLSRPKHDLHSPWSIELFANDAERGEVDRVLRPGKPPSIVGQTSDGRSIEIPQLIWNRWEVGTGALTGVTSEVVLGADALTGPVNKQFVTMQLSPTPFAMQEKGLLFRRYTGEISAEPDMEVKGPPLYWESSRGRITIALHYTYEDARVGESRSLVQIPVSTLTIVLETPGTSVNPREIMESLDGEIDDPLQLISYLSRCQVRCRAIRVLSHIGDKDRPDIHEMIVLRAGVFRAGEASRDRPLANPHRMAPDGLNTLVGAFKQSPYREVLRSTMIHLVTTFDSPYVELWLVGAFTALETITNGIGAIDKTDLILEEGKFEKLRRHVKDAIRGHATTEAISDPQVKSIFRKLLELNRPPIVPRVMELIERYNVEWKDLWPAVSLEQGLKAAFQLRNGLIHTGHVESGGRARIAAQRIHILVERLVFQILAGDQKWFDPTSFAQIHDIRALEWYLDNPTST